MHGSLARWSNYSLCARMNERPNLPKKIRFETLDRQINSRSTYFRYYMKSLRNKDYRLHHLIKESCCNNYTAQHPPIPLILFTSVTEKVILNSREQWVRVDINRIRPLRKKLDPYPALSLMKHRIPNFSLLFLMAKIVTILYIRRRNYM